MRQPCYIRFRQMQQRPAEAGIGLEATDEVLDYLGGQGFVPQFGARPLQRVILNELLKKPLSGKVAKDAVVEAVLEAGKYTSKT